ncbi:DoxX-like family protein [Rossellomorea aquimaris]|uniref:DoxX-like family protein n=1 Tax=Rossellomorea aquimaris TaxID=189382 RepID=UPI001CD64113|nr:DoxX-like family protein [Rossellomorea aquimaris]MCA1054121.1 DoxX-like family protein [Rossellomorea aquimaris]
MKNKPIYVEIPIEAPVEKVWEKSQDPKLHEQWDLRFSSITYLPKASEEDPQSFQYETKVGPIKVAGWGRSIGTHHKEDGSKTSSLHFGTEQKISPIREGRGYWRYIPSEKGTTFLTQYGYDVRFGVFGQVFDTFFRPLMGWATALSFDVLKQWIEKGESPRSQYIRFFSSAMITMLFFFVWLYQGLVPKIIARHPEEVSMLSSLAPLEGSDAVKAVVIIGILELLFGLVWLLYPKKRHLHAIQIVVFPVLTIGAVMADPAVSTHPFNPVTFNASLWILSIIGFLLAKDLPTAARCKRTRKGEVA